MLMVVIGHLLVLGLSLGAIMIMIIAYVGSHVADL